MCQTACGDEGREFNKEVPEREEECHVIHVIYPGCFEIKQCFSFIGEGKILKHCTKLNEASLYYLWVRYHGVRYLHNQSGFITPIKA